MLDQSTPRIDVWHVAWPVASLDRSITFYCDGLGFDLVGRDEDQAFVSLGKGGFTLEFIRAREAEPRSPDRAPDHIAFDSPDLEAWWSELTGRGLAVPELQVIGEGMKRFTLSDPDGLRLDFFQGRAGLEAFISGS